MSDRARNCPAVSVLMTVYCPDPPFFAKAVWSILEQTFEDFEFIIVEDPSERTGEAILAGFADPRVKYVVNRQRTSLTAQKNQGLQMAIAPYVAIMDADDVAHPTRLATQFEFLTNHDEIAVVGSQIAVIDRHDRIRGYRSFPVEHDAILRVMDRIVPLCHPSVMFRREVVQAFGGYQFTEYPVCQDYELWSRLIQSGVQFANCPDVLLYYRLHAGQMKFSELRPTIAAVLRVKERYWNANPRVRAKLRMWGESALLHLPQSWVKWLLISTLYRERRPHFKPAESLLAEPEGRTAK